MRRCATTLEAEMSAAEHAFLRQILCGLALKGRHLEIGTAAGGTLCAMMGFFPAESRPPFSVVDPMRYFPNQWDTVRQNLRLHGIDPELVDFRIGTSAELFPRAAARGETFDFVLIDGCHKIWSVTCDLRWTRLVNVGGVVCFHDYTPRMRGVWLAVNRFLARNRHYEVIGQADTLLAIRKRATGRKAEVDTFDEWYARAWHLPLQIERNWQRWRRSRRNARGYADSPEVLTAFSTSFSS
jgi:hypothetical protein